MTSEGLGSSVLLCIARALVLLKVVHVTGNTSNIYILYVLHKIIERAKASLAFVCPSIYPSSVWGKSHDNFECINPFS